MQEHEEVWELCTHCGNVIEDAGRTACYFCGEEKLMETELTLERMLRSIPMTQITMRDHNRSSRILETQPDLIRT